MKITFLGTGAADWLLEKPEGFTDNRRFSSAMIDDCLLIDPGPHVLSALSEYGKDIKDIKYVINTHKHSDHYNEDTLKALEDAGALFVEFVAGDEKVLGKYTVRAYYGNHSTAAATVHFIIDDGEKKLFYGLDSAWLMYEEVKGIKEHKPDFAVLDATIGDVDGDYRIFEHNNLYMVEEMQKTLAPYIKQFCISHMALPLHTDHKTLCERIAPKGILVAYDGLEVEI